jgi:hypothetical protein
MLFLPQAAPVKNTRRLYMSDFPLARTTMVHAVKHDGHLLIFVEGLTSGFGGKILVERGPERIHPPLFHIYARPGNDGIIPENSPQDMRTVAAYVFDAAGIPDSIHIHDAERQELIEVVTAETGVTPQASTGTAEDGDGNSTSDCEWTATHDFMPPGPARLRVQGTCVMPTPGYELSLSETMPKGFNPLILLLKLETKPTTAIVPTPTPVTFEKITDKHYSKVMILPDGVSIDVQVVH